MHFLNRIGAIILLICVAGISHVATLYVACGSTPAAIFWLAYPLSVVIGLLMWLKDWHNYSLLKFKWYDKEKRWK
jgi:hypothetical protein